MPAAKKKLSSKEKILIAEYLIDFNGKAAGERAGYAKTTAAKKCPMWVGKSRSSCPLNKRHVWDALQIAKQERSERVKIDADWLLKRLAQEAEADVSDLYNKNGGIKPIHDWPEIWRKGLVAGFDIEQKFICEDGDKVPDGYVIKIKISDRIKRLELIGKHVDVQAFKDQIQKEISGPNGGPIKTINTDMSASDAAKLYTQEILNDE